MPLNIVRDFHHETIMGLHEKERAPKKETELQSTQVLSQLLEQNEEILVQVRGMMMHFEWLLLTLHLIAPALEGVGKYNMIYECVSQELNDHKTLEHPLHAIELDRFMKVLATLQTGVTRNTMLTLATAVKLLFKSVLYGDYVLYDKLLVTLRNASMSQNEIMVIRRNYRYDKPELDEPEIFEYCKKRKEEDMVGRFECQIAKDQ